MGAQNQEGNGADANVEDEIRESSLCWSCVELSLVAVTLIQTGRMVAL